MTPPRNRENTEKTAAKLAVEKTTVTAAIEKPEKNTAKKKRKARKLPRSRDQYLESIDLVMKVAERFKTVRVALDEGEDRTFSIDGFRRAKEAVKLLEQWIGKVESEYNVASLEPAAKKRRRK